MSTTPRTLNIPTLEAKSGAKSRTSFEQEMELPELRSVEKDSQVEKDASIVSSAKTLEPRQQLSVAKERVFLAALCWGALVCGWNDGTLGPLLPRIQENYHVRSYPSSTSSTELTFRRFQVGYAVVSMLFVCSTIVCGPVPFEAHVLLILVTRAVLRGLSVLYG